MKRKTTKKGFTIIETTLATMFLGVIVLSVANLIIQMTHIYQKSLALRAINSTGQQIVEDMQRKINSADYLYDLDTNHDGYLVNKEIIDNMSKYFREWNVGASNSATDQKQIAGAFCVSDYTYIWNSPIPLKEDMVFLNSLAFSFISTAKDTASSLLLTIERGASLFNLIMEL